MTRAINQTVFIKFIERNRFNRNHICMAKEPSVENKLTQ